MYSRQKGIFQSVFSLVGLTITGYSLIIVISNLLIVIKNDLFFIMTGEQIFRSIAFMILFVYIGYLGMVITSLFPGIRVTESGLEVKYTFFVRIIPWDAIKGIVHAKWPNGAKAIIISPNGNIIAAFFMYYPQRLHGLITRVFEPAIIVTNEMENKEEISSEVAYYSSQQILR